MSDEKRGRGQPRHYEDKKERRNIRITDVCWNGLGKTAIALDTSRSELIEQFGRRIDPFTRILELEMRFHLVIKTPFEIGEPYFIAATPLGVTGWNGKPDYEASGGTLDEAVKNLAEAIAKRCCEAQIASTK
jgi:hypothetical protein